MKVSVRGTTIETQNIVEVTYDDNMKVVYDPTSINILILSDKDIKTVVFLKDK